jgi:hypothetical protein
MMMFSKTFTPFYFNLLQKCLAVFLLNGEIYKTDRVLANYFFAERLSRLRFYYAGRR